MRAASHSLLLCVLLCAGPAAAEHGPQPPLPMRLLQVDDVPLQVEVADETAEREHGLMQRSELPDGHGMLFVYRDSVPRRFWMRNTPLPLDAAFVSANGRISEVLPLEPFSEEVVTSRRPARYVIEVPRGWFAARDLGPGSRVTGLPEE